MFKLRDFFWKRSIPPIANCVSFAFKWETAHGRTYSPIKAQISSPDTMTAH